MKVQTLSAKKSIYLRRKSGNESMQRRKTKPQRLVCRVCSHDKKGLRSREKGLHLTRKKVSPHERKLPTWIFTRPLVVLVRTLFVIFAFLIQALGALKDQPLEVVCDEKNAKFYLERAKDYADKDICGGG